MSVIGLFVSDIHWSEQAPVARSAEPDWFAAQKRYMDQLRRLQQEYNGAPIFIAGDLFNKWNSSAHLINHVLTWISGMDIYAIPGNHDCPNHNYRQLNRSSYWTLVEANAIKHLSPMGTTTVGSLVIHPFPFGFSITPPNNQSGGLCLNVALVHDYIWTKGKGHQGASEEKRFLNMRSKLTGYDFVASGDNHKHFVVRLEKGEKFLSNCGAMIPRSMDEAFHDPCVTLLHEDGQVEVEVLDRKLDKWSEASGVSDLESSLELDLTEFANELGRLVCEGLNFNAVVCRWMETNSVPLPVKAIIYRVLGGDKDECKS